MSKNSRPSKHDRYIHMLFRQLPGAVWTTDRKLSLTYVAGRMANNMSPRATAGMSIYDVIGTHDPANPIVAYHLAAVSGKSQSFEYEANGRWYHCFVEQLTDTDGEVAGSIGAAFDTTEQRITQERLARSEARLAQAQRVAHIGSFEWEISSNAVTWSDELQRIYGLEPGAFGGSYEAFLERVHPEDVEKTKSTIFDALRTALPFGYDHRIVRADGSVRVLHTRGDIVTDEHGQPIRMAGCCWDVTELKETMNHLERTRSLLEATIEATADGLLAVDCKGEITGHNQRFLSLWRLSQDLVSHNSDAQLLALVRDQLEIPHQFLSETHEIYRHPNLESFDVQYFKDGRVFERYSRPQQIGDQIVGRVWSFRDVTERDRLLRRALFLADTTRLLTTLKIEAALDSVARLSVPFLGDACAIDLLGHRQPGRLVLVRREGLSPIDPQLHSVIMAGRSTIYSMGTRSCMAVPLMVKGAVTGAMTFVGPPLKRYSAGDLEFVETLARRVALSVENARLFREAREALRARDEFLIIAAHEIRGPITSIHMAAQALHKGTAAGQETAKLLSIIQREDRRLASFVNELVSLGKIQNGQMYFDSEEVDLGDVVREAATTVRDDLARSASALSITTEGHPVGQWDRHALAQVATNLLSNAIKFGDGKPIDIAIRETRGHTTLEVTDHGLGIHSETLDRIFKPFERGVSVRNYGGLGLGLFIVRTIVEGMGGVVRVRSTPGEGSTFTVELSNSRNQDDKQQTQSADHR
jgi:PAS domain S-box-containing protein